MKENAVRVYVYPQFKKILAIEAASRGKSIIQFTAETVLRKEPIKEMIEEWDKKWKKNVQKKGFDFP